MQQRPLRIPLHERQPGELGQAQGYEVGAVGGQAQLQRLLQQGLGVLEPALLDGFRAEGPPAPASSAMLPVGADQGGPSTG